MASMKLEFSAGGVIYKKEGNEFQIALILTMDGEWSFPKGHIEPKEKPEEAAIRECEEETGLANLKIGEMLEKSDYWFKFEDTLIHKFVYFYLIEAEAGSKLSAQLTEITDAQWFSLDAAMEIIGYKKQNQSILTKAFTKLGIE